MKKTANSYKHLKGVELWCINREDATWRANHKRKARGFVADIDPNVGITIKHTVTQEDLSCLVKDDSARYCTPYSEQFDFLVQCIERGYYDVEKDAETVALCKSGDFSLFGGCGF